MNTRIIGALLAALMCITMVAPAMAQTSPFVITGHVSDSDDNPCNGAWVQITNTNTSASWDAENDSASNYYKLVLNSDTVSAGNVLLFEASGCSETKIVEHAVTQSELEDGGMIGFDIVFDASQEIIWQGDVTLINGTTFDVTANSSVSYVINRTTALGALDAATEEGIFNYTVNDDWYVSWGSLFVDSIADIPNEGYNGWMYWVNYPEDPMPMVGADQFVLEDGDVVTWYWSSSMDTTPANSSMLVEINVTFLVDTIEPELILELINEGNVSTLYINSSEPLSNCTVDYKKCTYSSSKNWSRTLEENGTYLIVGTDLAGNEALRNLTLEIGKIEETIENQTNYSTGNVTLNITTTQYVAESNITICEYYENPVGSLETTSVSLLGINKFVQIEVDSHLNKSIGTVRISINYSDADRSKIDEDSLKLYVWNFSIEKWEELEPSGIDKVNKIVWGELNHLSLFSILGEKPTKEVVKDNNGGGGSGGGASGEPYDNIACSETDRQHVYANSDISYSFELERNIMQFVKFTSLKSAGQVATKVEILKDTSALVDNPPSDIVYKNLNIWVGNAGWATKKNIEDATVVFTVDKSWVTDNNIDESSIALYRYSDDTWHKLVTRKIAEDANSLQFEAETPGFSPFAVTGKELEGEPGGEGIIAGPAATVDKTPAPTPTEKKGMPGFSLFAGLSILLIAVQLLRKKK